MVNEKIKGQLEEIPGWTITQNQELDSIRDNSRPEGWGDSDSSVTSKELTYFGGVGFEVDEMVSGTFELPETKGEVYGKCVQAILNDVIQKIENKDHKLAITLEDAYEALMIAVLSSENK